MREKNLKKLKKVISLSFKISIDFIGKIICKRKKIVKKEWNTQEQLEHPAIVGITP